MSDLVQLRSTLEKIKLFLAQEQGKVTEADTRANLVDPLVASLGYTNFNEVKREVFVKDTKDRLDYVLNVEGTRRVGIEAKTIHHDLTDGDAGQLIQYCSILGIEWAVLTNGAQLWLYHQFAKAPLAGKLVFKLELAAWTTEAELSRWQHKCCC